MALLTPSSPTHRHKQAGFTLVETGIVLVIVGLVLGGLLKGQDLISSAKVKDLVRDFQSVSIHVVTYQDRFKRLPGDDSNVADNFGGTPATTPVLPAARNNQRIEGQWNSRTVSDESYLFWEHLRLANLASGSTDTAAVDTYVPRNAAGGRLGVSSALVAGWSGNYFICSSNVLGHFARVIDLQMDDGDTASGAIRVFTNDDNNAVVTTPVLAGLTPANNANLYTVCIAY